MWVIKMSLGKRLKALRKARGFKQRDLAKVLGISENTMYRWEADMNTPSDEDKKRLASILGTSLAYLMGETDNPIQIGKDNIFKDYDLIPVALISPEQTACCGAGLIDMDTTYEPEKILVLSRRELGEYDPSCPPYAIHTDGISMEGFGIPSGSIVFINPREELNSFDICLICYYGRLAIKKIIFKPDGSFEIFSDLEDDNREISKEEFDSGLFEIRGKVIAIHSRPGHGRF
mgnify:FL=1|jgi:transcriptional regulator with XRE-family HTH domain